MTITTVDVLATPDEEREADVASGAPVELTVAFTDLEDFTTYTEAEGDDAARRLLIGHHRESGPIVRSRGGRVLKLLGDGLMLTFPAPEAAVLACLELGEAAPLPLRAGIHRGKVLVTGDDVIGRVVNLAARVTVSPPTGTSWSSPTTCEPRWPTCAASPSMARTRAASRASKRPCRCTSRSAVTDRIGGCR